MILTDEIRQAIRDWRTAKGLSLTAAARQIGVSRVMVGRWENGIAGRVRPAASLRLMSRIGPYVERRSGIPVADVPGSLASEVAKRFMALSPTAQIALIQRLVELEMETKR